MKKLSASLLASLVLLAPAVALAADEVKVTQGVGATSTPRSERLGVLVLFRRWLEQQQSSICSDSRGTS